MPKHRLLLSLLALVSLPACAQYTARKIVFTNPGEASQQQLEAVSGFHAGTRFSRDELTAAAQKIADTGLYDTVGAAVDGNQDAALTVIFNLKPANTADYLAVGFENFVWLTPAEITSAIRTKLPLYNGRLPEAGTQADVAAEALAETLRHKGITGPILPVVGAVPVAFKVEHEIIEPTLQHPERVMDFRVTQPLPVVANIKLGGVDSSLAPLLQTAVNKTVHTAYNEGKGGFITREAILAPLLDAGYEQAILSRTTIEIGAVAQGKVPLVLTTTLAPGPLYKVSAITFPGAPLYSAGDFAKDAKLHAGDRASRKALLATLQPLYDAYRSKGFMDAVVKADPAFDASAGTVAYTVTVVPGEPYRVKEITVDGLDPAARADFDRSFQLHSGDLYNPLYVGSFLSKNQSVHSLSGYGGTFKAYAHPETHTVDVVLQFASGGPQSVTVR